MARYAYVLALVLALVRSALAQAPVVIGSVPTSYGQAASGSANGLAPGAHGDVFLQLPGTMSNAVYCHTEAQTSVTNVSGASPATVSLGIGVSNPVPGALGTNCPMFPFVGVAHSTAATVLNLLASQSGGVINWRDDVIFTDSFCLATQVVFGPPFQMFLGTNGTSIPQMDAQLTNNSGAGVNVNWSTNIEFTCHPIGTCNKSTCGTFF